MTAKTCRNCKNSNLDDLHDGGPYCAVEKDYMDPTDCCDEFARRSKPAASDPLDLDAIRRLHDEATRTIHAAENAADVADRARGGEPYAAAVQAFYAAIDARAVAQQAFACRAYADIPALLAEIERLRKQKLLLRDLVPAAFRAGYACALLDGPGADRNAMIDRENLRWQQTAIREELERLA